MMIVEKFKKCDKNIICKLNSAMIKGRTANIGCDNFIVGEATHTSFRSL